MTSTHDLEKALRTMDPSPCGSAVEDDARTDADLRRILATDPRAPERRRRWTAAPGPRGWPSMGRLALAGVVVAAVAAGVVVAPSILGRDAVYADWEASPNDLTPAESEKAGRSCRNALDDGGMTTDRYSAQLAEARTAIAERRGAWTLVVLTGDGGFSATCMTDSGRWSFLASMIGSVGVLDVPEPGPRELVATDLGTGGSEANQLSVAAGFAGSDITGVTYRSPSHGDVIATVNEGHFALWMPGDDLEDAASEGADVEVTYRDAATSTVTLDLQ